MPNKTCPVDILRIKLTEIIDSGRLQDPKSRRIAEEIRELIKDIAWGRAGDEHLSAIESLAQELIDNGVSKSCVETGRLVQSILSEHQEIFASHVQTHNCVTGDCVKLVPAPCQRACPAGIDVPTYVSLIGMGRDQEAIDIIREDNPFPWVCGLVCTRPCEFMCVRKRIDTSICIKSLKAFAAERVLSRGSYKNPPKTLDKNKKVCVIGAGPGGMSAAYYLALKGYSVRVIEALPVPGGMMMMGIPRYRLPREVIDREVAKIEELGVEFVFNTRFGTDITLEQLKVEGFEAFFFAIGAQKPFDLNISGESDFPQVIDAITLLRNVALGKRMILGQKVVVVGGGNVAIDAARTCLRLGSQEVTIAYRRTRADMPADEEEVEQAEEEGIRLLFLTIPVEIIGEEGRVTELHCHRAELIALNESKRKYPKPVLGSDFFIGADTIITAIGQQVDYTGLESLRDLDWTRRGTINVDMVSMQTTIEGIFAAGDAVTGPATVIEAIGGGKKAADAIDRYLSGIPQPKMPPVPVRRRRVECLKIPANTKMIQKRPEMPLLNIDRRRTTFQQAELGLSENIAREEARRCLRCDICRRCGECIEICRDKMKIDALKLGYFDFDHPVKTDFRGTEEKCIVCGACATNCPNEAMKMEDINGERILSLCGTILNRQKLEYCEICGAVIGPARYHDYISGKMKEMSPVADDRVICETCARKETAKFKVPTSHI